MLRVAAIAIVLTLGGCAPPEVPVQVVADSYCLGVKKRTWSINDTQESIDEAIRINAGIDKACPKKS